MKNKKIVEIYETICKKSNIDIITTGRYLLSQGGDYSSYLADDIANKLELKKEDKLIDIGCNIGIYHGKLKDKVSFILGIDAGKEIIKKAQKKNSFANVDYLALDVIDGNWSAVEGKFSKALVYSVIHIFDSLDDVRKLLKNILTVMEGDFIILFGEVRDKELYNKFKERKKFSMRDVKFFFNKMFNSFYLKGLPPGEACTVFSREEIIGICYELGLKAQPIIQSNKHPFYNVCIDYIIRKK